MNKGNLLRLSPDSNNVTVLRPFALIGYIIML